MSKYATRQYTNKLIEMACDGVITWESLANACLGYMSEADVQDMAEIEWDVNLNETDEEV